MHVKIAQIVGNFLITLGRPRTRAFLTPNPKASGNEVAKNGKNGEILVVK